MHAFIWIQWFELGFWFCSLLPEHSNPNRSSSKIVLSLILYKNVSVNYCRNFHWTASYFNFRANEPLWFKGWKWRNLITRLPIQEKQSSRTAMNMNHHLLKMYETLNPAQFFFFQFVSYLNCVKFIIEIDLFFFSFLGIIGG